MELTRREFINTAALSGAGILLAGAGALQAQNKSRKKYALVGTGSRSGMYQEAILKTYAEYREMVGYCDRNHGRLQQAQRYARSLGRPEPPIYDAGEFDRMISETQPDIVIVTTVDGFHHQYIVRAMERGCDVLTEKPLTTNAEKCRSILKAVERTGRKCTVAFNYRYSPARTQVKDLLMSGVIGDVLSVDFHWMLNTRHGTDYFRRWHSQKKNSGGLMVHKATHHFDLINWWLSAIPVSVYATGKREFYTPEMAKRMGLAGPHERCHTCPEKSTCAFELDLAANPAFKELYLDNEHYDGYFRDRCVFRPEIDIEDTMNVLVRYDNHVTMAYSLNAFNAWEGYHVVFNGTKGRLEHKAEEQVYLFGDGSVPGAIKGDGTFIRIYPLREPAYTVEVWQGEGGHGGGDTVMLDDLFSPERKPDKYMRAADQRSGAYSCLTGIAANRSMATGKPVEIVDLAGAVGYPDYPRMPGHDEPLPMPLKV
ncbi:MAG TPA: Gfo/Idh/MocA family oxidoreductase [bacterium]|nr:Gfo/Idh/MocA family oxidoreductase [bacterium]HPR89017.1 Gfo/Idh/MocA family oxidoreductase [bacterium]